MAEKCIGVSFMIEKCIGGSLMNETRIDGSFMNAAKKQCVDVIFMNAAVRCPRHRLVRVVVSRRHLLCQHALVHRARHRQRPGMLHKYTRYLHNYARYLQ